MTRTIPDVEEHAPPREAAPVPLRERLPSIQAQFAAISRPGGLTADKAFFDALSGEA